MNLYDTRPITCIMCGKLIGEMEYNTIVLPRCGDCSKPKPEGDDDAISYLERRFENTVKNLVVSTLTT